MKKRIKKTARRRNDYLLNYQPKTKHRGFKRILAFACILIYLVLIIMGTVSLVAKAFESKETKLFTYERNTVECSPVLPASFPEDVPEQINKPLYSEDEVTVLSKTVYGEALVTNSDTEMAAVVWCILNRVDSPKYPNSIIEVATQRSQFHGYKETHPVTDRIEYLVRDVLDRYFEEKSGKTDVGRILPPDYLYFYGDGRHNHYTKEWKGSNKWDWSLTSPYSN